MDRKETVGLHFFVLEDQDMRLILFSFFLFCEMPFVMADPIHVILDPGHGGPTEWGYTTTGFDEKTTNLVLAKKIQTILESKDDFEVVLSRIGDFPVTLNDRRKTANQYNKSIFISIHSSTYDKEPHVYTYVLKQVPATSASILTPIESAHSLQYKNSVKFAQILEEEFPENMNHEIVMAPFPLASLIGIQSPAILVECACVSSNATSSEANLEEFSRNIAEGIDRIAGKVY